MIRELTRLAQPRPAYHPSARYVQTGSYPWYHETTMPRSTMELAYADAAAWAAIWRERDPIGNMAEAFGVVREASLWRGVVNYYHSNT